MRKLKNWVEKGPFRSGAGFGLLCCEVHRRDVVRLRAAMERFIGRGIFWQHGQLGTLGKGSIATNSIGYQAAYSAVIGKGNQSTSVG